MTVKNQLELLQKEFTALKSKITTKLQQKDQALQETTTKLQTSTRQLETTLKENTENEKFLTQLIKEFQELKEAALATIYAKEQIIKKLEQQLADNKKKLEYLEIYQ
ncbi:10204_t:CDS:2 [Entrophospora sp. SA101]|nr:10204_t:CDS:2 [Entrophospora sp. SA101]